MQKSLKSTPPPPPEDLEAEPFELSPEDEAELLRRRDEIRKGHFVDGDDLLRNLK